MFNHDVQQITLDIDQIDIYDYENSKNIKYNQHDIQKMLNDEINNINQKEGNSLKYKRQKSTPI